MVETGPSSANNGFNRWDEKTAGPHKNNWSGMALWPLVERGPAIHSPCPALPADQILMIKYNDLL